MTKPRQSQERPLGFAVLPYVKGVSDRVGRVLRKFHVRPAFRPVRTLGQIFKKPKDRPTIDQVQAIAYKVSCHDCTFTYVGESKRSWSSRGPSMIQAVRATANQQLNSMPSPRITTSTQGTPRSSNEVLQPTTRGFSWSHGTQLWTAPPSTKGNLSLALTYRWLVARAVTNLKITTLLKVERSHRKFRTENNRSDNKNLGEIQIPITDIIGNV